MVEVVLGNLVEWVQAIHAIDVDTSAEYLPTNNQQMTNQTIRVVARRAIFS